MAKKKSLVQLIFFVFLFFLILLSFLGYPDRLFVREENRNSSRGGTEMRGLSILVKGTGEWDLFEYVCKRGENCAQSPTMGKRLSTVSGGGVEEDEHEVVIDYDETWSEYEQVKIFVRPAPDSDSNSFRVEGRSDIPRSEIKVMGEDKNRVEAVIVPVSTLDSGYHELAIVFKSD